MQYSTGGAMRVTEDELIVYCKDTYWLEPPEKYGAWSLVQLADITARWDWYVKPHAQFCHEIVMMLDGEAEICYNTQTLRVRAGQMVIIPEGVIHDVRYVSPMPARMLLLGVRMDGETDPYVKQMFELPLPGKRVRICTFPRNLRMLFEMLIDEYFNRGDRSYDVIRSLLSVILVHTSRQYVDVNREPLKPLHIEGNADELTQALCLYIREHALDMASLEELSREFSYSYSYLSHHFRKEAGYSIKEYWDHYRFQHVLQLMRNSALSITQIAQQVHYQSIHTFSRSFRTRFGMSPTEYRRALHL